MERLWLETLRDLLWELIVAHEKGEVVFDSTWLRTVVATHASLEEWLEENQQ
jgi:hypothetical protein